MDAMMKMAGKKRVHLIGIQVEVAHQRKRSTEAGLHSPSPAQERSTTELASKPQS